jgi:methionyl-tRNA synthetase
MANEPKRYLVTAALPYANGPLHIGHIGGAYLSADIYSRYLRSKGREVLFVCGSDEHGAAITLRARKEGKTPKEIVDYYHEKMRRSFEDLGISFDIYHRTSSIEHIEMSQSFFQKLKESGSFEAQTSQQYYDSEAKQFLADRYIMGTCPKCSNERAYGDQCENCGSSLSPLDLIQPKSVLTGSTPELKETTHWYLPMQNHESWVRNYIKEGLDDSKKQHEPSEWKAHVLGQCMSWIDGGLQSRAMTRDLDWGVPVPGEPGKVLYVWLDAPIGYITNTKVWADAHQRNWEDYWKSEDTRMIQFIGKDNIVFHCIIFPILLKAHGSFILPYNVPANEFVNLEGDKISTSRNWAVWLHEYLEDFPGKEDELRYVLCSIMPEQKDSEFTWSDYRERVNNELADILGNYLNRVIVLTHKYFEGRVPALTETLMSESELNLGLQVTKSVELVGKKIEEFRFREALAEVMNIARTGNKYLTESEPWKLIKTDQARVANILHQNLNYLAKISIVIQPFLPFTSAKILRALNIEHSFGWDHATKNILLEEGHQIGLSPILFEKVTEENIDFQVEKLRKSKVVISKPSEPFLPEVGFEDFQKMDLRIAGVKAAEKVAKTKKLLKLTLDLGTEERTVVSGIAENYEPSDIIGRKVLYLANLSPKEIKGIKSHGMVLMAIGTDGKMSIISPVENASAGDVVR